MATISSAYDTFTFTFSPRPFAALLNMSLAPPQRVDLFVAFVQGMRIALDLVSRRSVMKQLFLLSLFMTTVASCSGSNSSHGDGGTAITGNAGGHSLSLVDGVFHNLAAKGLEFNGVSTTLLFPTYANACTQLTAGNAVASSGLLFVGLADVAADGTVAPITTSGSYVIFSGSVPASSRSAQAFVEYLDSSCMRSSLVPATSGTITITRVGDKLIEGSVELTFGAGESISGTFSSSLCDGFSPNSSAFATCT